MPPATVTTWPVTWPEISGEAERYDLGGYILGLRDLRQRHRSGLPRRSWLRRGFRRVIGEAVQPGATALTRHAAVAGGRPRSSATGAGRRGSPTSRRRSRHGPARRTRPAVEPTSTSEPSRSPRLREEAAGGEERRGQVRVDRLPPALERAAPRPGRSPPARRPRPPRTRRAGRSRRTSGRPSFSSVRSAWTTARTACSLGPLAARGGSGRPHRRPRRRTAGRRQRRCRPTRP